MRPKSQKEIEKKAFDLNIEIDWRLGSRFESEFVCIENSTIASHFFSNDHSIISLISDIIEEKNIKYFILENVKGLINHDSGNTFETIKATFDELGYKYFYQVLNTHFYRYW